MSEQGRRDDAIRLMTPMLADAGRLVREGRATAPDVDLAMRLGAGHPAGPLEVAAGLPEAVRARLGLAGIAAAPAGPPGGGGGAWAGPIGLVGTGTMAGGIAEAVARSGRQVLVLARAQPSHEAMMMRIGASLARSVDKGRFSAAEGDEALGRIVATDDPAALAGCDLVIEAVREELAVKLAVIGMLDRALPAGLPIATNTSSFRVGDLAGAAPGRPLFAMHFFNPAQAMKLVELVFPDGGSPALRASATAFVRAIGKTSVACGDHRGFLVNRLLIPFLNDAVRAHEAGRPVEEIDRTMVEGLGHPMGPFALIDLIGLDTTAFALTAMAETEGDPRIAPAASFGRLIAEGRLGRKSGRGFIDHGARA